MKTANKTRAALENRALLAARALIDRMRALYRELEQLTGAPIGLHRALVCIGNEPGLQASLLAVRLGMQRPAVSQVLKSLTMRGWIERRRSDADQRAIQIHATAAGRQILRATAGRAVFTLQRAVCRLPQTDLEKLASSVELLLGLVPEAGRSQVPAPARRARRRRPASRQRRA
jgi:MarR family transcriptional regulator for hemolysin